MSFASDVKQEIVRIRPKNESHRLAELSGIIFVSGSIVISKALSLTVKTENPDVAKHVISLAKNLPEIDTVWEEKKQEHRRALLYTIHFNGDGLLAFLNKTGYIRTDCDGWHFITDIPAAFRNGDEVERSFLRGCFLGSGSCSDPKGCYSAEIVCPTEPFACSLSVILSTYDLAFRVSSRRGKFIVYCKDGDSVTGFLALLGSHSAALSLENVRAERETRNYVNRATNCENANIDKTVEAALRQKQAIEYLMQNNLYSQLPRTLQEAAELRLEYPDATLQELADLAGIKKSGINHRLARLVNYYQDICLHQ